MASTLRSELLALVVHDASGAPLIGTPVSLMTPAGNAAFDPVRVLAEEPAERLSPVLTAVAPGFTSGVCASPELREPAAATDALLDGLEREARARGAGAAAFLYLPEDHGSLLERRAAGRGYRSVVVAGRCVLRVAWRTFGEYLRSRTRTRRKSIRAEVERFGAELEVEATGVEGLTDELIPLHAQWRAKHGHPVSEEELRRQYAAIRERLGPAVRLFVARRDGRPAAFAQFYDDEGTLYSRAIGFDYERVEGAFAYYNLLFYEPLRHAMAHGIRALDYSFESYEAKLGRGCTLQHFLLLLKPLVPAEPWLDECLRRVDRERRAEFARLRELHP